LGERVTYDLHPSALIGLGAILTLTVILLTVVLYAWSSIGAHVAKALTEAGKRAVDARLGEEKVTPREPLA
jgi:hypothetical protein